MRVRVGQGFDIHRFTDDPGRPLSLLATVAGMVRGAGWEIGNVDVSVVCEVPRLAPNRTAMERNLSGAAGAPVTVKGRRAEGLGALGRREGVACWAVAVITAG